MFDTGDFANNNSATLVTAYLDAFQQWIKPDGAEWQQVKEYWMDNIDVREREYDIQTKSAIEEFVSKVHNSKTWANGEGAGFDWGYGTVITSLTSTVTARRGPVYIPGQKIVEWKRKDYGDVKLVRALHERGILAAMPVKRSVTPNGPDRRVWPVVADDTPAVREGALHYVDPEAGNATGDRTTERPEGLQ
jgi:hypothetical protein